MEETLRIMADISATLIEGVSIVAVSLGALEAAWHTLRELFPGTDGSWTRRAIFVRFAGWIVIALEFTLGADIIRTAVAPTWDDIGKLAAIAGIRTALNFFLERDIEEAVKDGSVDGKAVA